jgi:hypothetical protein
MHLTAMDSDGPREAPRDLGTRRASCCKQSSLTEKPNMSPAAGQERRGSRVVMRRRMEEMNALDCNGLRRAARGAEGLGDK